MLESLTKKLKQENVAVFIDGPNTFRKQFDIDLDELREDMEVLGSIRIAKVFLDQYASEKLIEAVSSQGFEPLLGLGQEKSSESDVDVYMAVHAMEAVYNSDIDRIVLVTRDADFLPVLQEAKEKGKETIVMGVKDGFSTALRNAADKVIFIGD
ncbi:MAG: TIGR00288 family NYN domain-containing protein [Candidatus Nanohaloarchaeota archaeon QJJ-9]|nr:TIGR00288 family NYN domain-containing protein [Candidatus Nanohaloarchaeota archaeon QJJ-9]